VANPLGIFFSRLAPEDKRFIKRIGFFLFFLLILSGAGLYFYTQNAEKKPVQLEKLPPAAVTDSVLDTAAIDTATVEMPSVPEIPGLDDLDDLPQDIAPKASDDSSLVGNFDEQAHLQLMRQNAKEYNYKMAYRHGARIEGFLITKPELRMEWGHILLETGKPEEAVPVLQKAVASDSAKSNVVVDMALAMFRSGDADGAISFLDSAMRTNKDLILTTAKAAIIGEYPDTTKRASAEAIFKTILKSKPSLPDANYQYGRFLMRRGDFKNSKTHLERAVKEKPNEPRYIARLGMAEFYLKNDAIAETLYTRALKINPYDYNTWFNLGELYLSRANESVYVKDIRQKTHKAMEAYLKAIENDSLHANAHYRVGIILNGNSGHKEAIRHLTMALERMPNNIPVMKQMSAAYMQIGDTTKSIYFLEEILRIDPFDKIAASEYRRIKNERD
jgi:tetratricopeptide (TPR) repeat protein